MKHFLTILTLVSVLLGCGPSQGDLLRTQQLEAQRAQAAADLLREEQARALRLQQRTEDALKASKTSALATSDIQQLFANTTLIDQQKTYYVRAELQATPYQYQEKQQSFAIVGMRKATGTEPYAALMKRWQQESILEMLLYGETETNRINQTVLKKNGQRLVVALPDFKLYELLSSEKLWSWEKGLFSDLTWQVSPEEAWNLTEKRSAQVQIGLRLCQNAECKLTYSYQNHPTQSLVGDVISILVLDSKSNRVLAKFIRTEA